MSNLIIDDFILFEYIKKYKSYFNDVKHRINENTDKEIVQQLLELGTKAYAARNELIFRYMSIAEGSITHDQSGKILDEDLKGEALSELRNIIDKFDIERYTTKDEFTNYVRITIKNHTLRYIQNQNSLIRIPEQWHTYRRKINQFIKEYESIHHTKPDVVAIATECGLTLRMVKDVMNIDYVNESFDELDFTQQIYLNPEQQMINDTIDNIISETIEGLEYRKKEIFNDCMAQIDRKVIAEKYQISEQRVSQIYHEVMNKMNNAISENPTLESLKDNIKRIHDAIRKINP